MHLLADEQFLQDSEQAIEFLERLLGDAYWINNLPSGDDMRIQHICELYMAATALQREVFISSLTKEACWRLGTFAARMAMLGARRESKQILVHGLLALMMKSECQTTDFREILMTLSIIHNSTEKLGITDTVFNEVVQYGTEPARDLILGYLRRSPENKNIEDMGWKEVEGPSGLIYQYGNQSIPEGFL